MSQPDPARMRISDAERETVAAQLRDALDSGRLNLHEFDERSRDLYEAQTYGEVKRLLEDLPAANLPAPSAERPAPAVAPVPPAAPSGNANLMGHIALGMGVASFASFMPFTILAIVFGLIGLDNFKKGKADQRSFALAGLILGIASIPVWTTFIVIGVLFWW